MPTQKIKILRDEENPFDVIEKEVELPKGVKLLSQEPYVLDVLHYYFRNNEASLKPITDNQIIDSKIIYISESSLIVDINGKENAHIDLQKEKMSAGDFKIGDVIKVKVKRGNREAIEASIGAASNQAKIEDLVNSIGNNTVAFKAQVKELINGGYYLTIDDIRVFMPGSLAGMNKLSDFESLLGKEIIVMPVNFSKERNIVVVSHREYLKTLVPVAIERVTETIEDWREGKVTGTSGSGVFVEFEECLTGLIPLAEMEKTKNDFDKGIVKPGNIVHFRIKQILSDTKIILTEKEREYSPWDDIETRLKPETSVSGKVVKKTSYGLFIEIEKGVNGLLHSSNLKGDNFEEGDAVTVIITKIDPVNRKITLRKKS
jgi:small subunit ribosomal protein S1